MEAFKTVLRGRPRQYETKDINRKDAKRTSMKNGTTDEPAHLPLHAFLIFATLITLYPIFWVFTIAFSGNQSLAIADLPANPTISDRIRAITPWPKNFSVSNFTSVMKDQPFARWLVNSAIVA